MWIGRRSDSPVGAEFVANHHERIPGLVKDLVEFCRRDDVPPLVLVALSHAQFETIHPFTDGNGRTGRALAQSLLRALRVTRNVEQLIAEIDEIREAWSSRLKARSDSNAWRVLDILTRHPVLNSSIAAEQLGVQQPNVYPPLSALEKAGILTAKSVHHTGPFWRSDEILAAIDRFAERAGRREQSPS